MQTAWESPWADAYSLLSGHEAGVGRGEQSSAGTTEAPASTGEGGPVHLPADTAPTSRSELMEETWEELLEDTRARMT